MFHLLSLFRYFQQGVDDTIYRDFRVFLKKTSAGRGFFLEIRYTIKAPHSYFDGSLDQSKSHLLLFVLIEPILLYRFP